MSELILKTVSGSEFWRDSDDCTAPGNFNIFYFTSHDEEMPEAVATDCDSYEDAFDQLSGDCPDIDLERFKQAFITGPVGKIFDAVDIDLGSREQFDEGADTEYSSITGMAWLSEQYAKGGDDVIVFNLIVPTWSTAYVVLCSPLPANIALAEETIEAAILDATEKDVESLRMTIAAEHIGEATEEAVKSLKEAADQLDSAVYQADCLRVSTVQLEALRARAQDLTRDIERYLKALY